MKKEAGACRSNTRAKSTFCGLALSGLLAGCGGGGSSDNSAAPPSGGDTQQTAASGDVAGKVRYEYVPPQADCRGLDYDSIELRPVRGATVELIDAGDGRVIDSAVSDESGDYSLSVEAERRVFVRVRAELKRSGAPAWDVEVRDNTRDTDLSLPNRPLFVLDSSEFTTDEDERVLNLTARSGWDGSDYESPRAAAPFAILDTMYDAMSLVVSADSGAQFAPLDVFWSTNNSTTRSNGGFNQMVSSGQIGTSFYSPGTNSLFLLGRADDDTEEFDSHVIAHEWGHYFEDNFSRSDSIGGPHSLSEPLDMRLAFGEGWATALAGMALADPLYCDTFGAGQSSGFRIDLENSTPGGPGWFNELSVTSILYDLWDAPEGDDDGGSLGFAPIFEVLVEDQRDTPAFTSIFSFATALRERNPDHAAFIDRLLGQQDINGVDAYGEGETNDNTTVGSSEDVLPIYVDIRADGVPVELCSNSQHDTARAGNKLSEHRYLRLEIGQPGAYEISVVNSDPPSSPPAGFDCSDPDNADDPEISRHSDPDFFLLRDGQTVLDGESCTANSETAVSDLPAGVYAMNVLEFRFADEDTPSDFPERSCFEVTVTPAP